MTRSTYVLADAPDPAELGALEWYAKQFERSHPRRRGLILALSGLRKQAFASFSSRGFPTTADEEWRYTNVSPFVRTRYVRSGAAEHSRAPAALLKRYLIPGVATHRVVFVNGHYDASASTAAPAPGLEISPFSTLGGSHPLSKLAREQLGRAAAFADRAFVALNTALFEDGVVVRLRKGTVVPEPVHILFVDVSEHEEAMSFPRVLIIADEAAQGTIVETHAGVGERRHFSNAVTEIIAAPGAILSHTKVQLEGRSGFHVGSIAVHQSGRSTVTSNLYNFGGGLVRNEIDTVLDGEGSEAFLNGLTVANGAQHIDNHTVIDHAQPRAQSTELFKGIFAEKSRGVFSGTIIVRPGAQKTNAIQSNRNLLLSDAATIDSKPQLKIYADDVRCTHGATVGQLDEDALFYLRSRGLSLNTARNMLIHAFAGEVILKAGDGRLVAYLETLLLGKVESGASGAMPG